LRPISLGADLTGADLTWGRLDWKSKEDDKKESKYQKYIYYASNGYQYCGESGQDTNRKLFIKSVTCMKI